jgi:hypothetical protein
MGDAADIAHEYGLHFPMSWENWHIHSDPNTKVPPPDPTRKAEK